MLQGGYFDEILSPLCHITNRSRAGLWLELRRFILCDQGSLLFRLSMNPLAHTVYLSSSSPCPPLQTSQDGYDHARTTRHTPHPLSGCGWVAEMWDG